MSLAAGEVASKQPIIFFDGYCVLCNGFVDFIYRRDKKRDFAFASLQGETAKRLLPGHCLDEFRSVVYLANGNCELRSTAVLSILGRLGGAYKVALVLKIVPRPLRDFVYDWIASHRYRWFGKREQCRLPQPEDKGRMLD